MASRAQRRMGKHEKKDEVEPLSPRKEKPDKLGRKMRGKQIKRHIKRRVIKKWQLRREKIEAEPSGNQGISVVPVIVPQIPIGILAEEEPQQSDQRRNRGKKDKSEAAGRTLLRRQKRDCCVFDHNE